MLEPPAPKFAFVGFGALASELAAGLRRMGVDDLRAYIRPQSDPAAGDALRRRLDSAGVRPYGSIGEATAGVDVVVAAVPAAAAREVAEACVNEIDAGSLYVDPAPVPPRAKEQAAELLARAGAGYVDAAVLGTVATEGARVPILAAGPGAKRFAEIVVPLGMDVSVIEGPPGRASLVKLLRSVYMKGRDALILEMLLAARCHGLEATVVGSIRGAGEQVAFPVLATRVLTSLALHAERRADELAASADVLSETGIEPIVTQAGSERLRRLGRLGLRTHFHGERPGSFEEVLAALDALAEQNARPLADPPRLR